jgi:hypothetical protein
VVSGRWGRDQVDKPGPRRYAHDYEQQGQDQRGAQPAASDLRHRTSSERPRLQEL